MAEAIIALVGGIAGAGLEAYGQVQSAKELSSSAKERTRALSATAAALRSRDILAYRRSPFTQAVGTSLLSQFTSLSEEQAQQLIQQSAASQNPMRETLALPGGAFPGQEAQFKPINVLDPGLTYKEKARAIRNNALAKVQQQAIGMGHGTVAPNPFSSLAGGSSADTQFGPISIQNTDVISQEQLQGLRSQEQGNAAGLIEQARMAAQQGLAARGLSGATSTDALLAPQAQGIFSGISQRASARELAAEGINRQAYMDILSLFSQFGEQFAGTYS